MNLEEVVEYMVKHPAALKMGSGKIANRTHSKRADVILAKEIVRRKSNSIESIEQVEEKKTPKILLFDIETSPMRAYVWKRWKENVSLEQVISDWYCICWSAKWLFSNRTMSDCLTTPEVLREDDSRIMQSLHDLIDEADIVVSMNGNNFDIPRINSRFIINDLPPTKPFFSVDVYQIVKKQFGFSCNSLNGLARYFGFESKLDTNFDLWKRCVEGDPVALHYMETYNKRDVDLLEEVYLKLLPWIKRHPNIGNIINSDKLVCPNCGCEYTTPIEGKFYFTGVGKYQLHQCSKCGAIFRDRVNLNKTRQIKAVSI